MKDRNKLRKLAVEATAGEWCAFVSVKSSTFAIHTPDDERHGNIINWMGFDGVSMSKAQKARNAKYIAAANPKTMLELLDELEVAKKRIADLEKDTEQLICERDACEEVIGNLYESVMGHSPEWTSAFGYEHAELEVMDQCDEWRKTSGKGV
ncbi:ead/Ea22-like family protein [Citrobacter freundii]|uniref:ead/Ea22-like family protein n=1 Tax=Citrobacter freundii TaxID=546 RepID=UPI002B255106|nr:ead/Ea22-like family protein [Citrobacter freundii]MEB2478126.1 ead/Ea22-like family protein [Citrobacter freundii]